MMPRMAMPARLLATALTGAFAIAVTACSGGAGSTSSAGTASPAGAVSAAKALTLAAGNAKRATSFSATMDIVSSGTYNSHLKGTLDEQTKPVLLAHQKFAVTSAGMTLPGGMETLLTGDAVYLKMSSLSRMVGKPWIKIPFSSLKSSMGANFEPLIRQAQSSNPLAFAQLLPASSNVRAVGSQTINGVQTTEYTGTLDPVKALTRRDPSLKKILMPTMAATHITTDRFTVWVDGQHQVRKLQQVMTGRGYKNTSVMVVTSVNQPVHIQVPPAGQTAGMPGM